MNSLGPMSESVNEVEEIGKALRSCKGAYKVHIEIVETAAPQSLAGECKYVC